MAKKRDQKPFAIDPDYVPPPLSPEVDFEVQCILDAAARRKLEQKLRDDFENGRLH